MAGPPAPREQVRRRSPSTSKGNPSAPAPRMWTQRIRGPSGTGQRGRVVDQGDQHVGFLVGLRAPGRHHLGAGSAPCRAWSTNSPNRPPYTATVPPLGGTCCSPDFRPLLHHCPPTTGLCTVARLRPGGRPAAGVAFLSREPCRTPRRTRPLPPVRASSVRARGRRPAPHDQHDHRQPRARKMAEPRSDRGHGVGQARAALADVDRGDPRVLGGGLAGGGEDGDQDAEAERAARAAGPR